MITIVLISIVLLSFVLRLVLNLSHDGYLGVDGGAYLLSVNYVLGNEPTGAGFPRPPLAPGWLLVPFTHFWGYDIGYKIWTAVAAGLPAIPVYLLTRQYVKHKWAPVFAVGFLSLDLTHSEMMVTGALPLIGFTLIGIGLWAIGKLANSLAWEINDWRYSLRYSLILSISIGLIPWVNQTTAGLAVIVLPIYAIALTVLFRCPIPCRSFWHHRRYIAANLILPTVGAVILGIGALPWYTKIAPNSDILHFGGGYWIYPSRLGDIAWIQATMAIVLGCWTVKKASDYRLKSLGVVLITLGILSPWLSYDETVINIFYRAGYLMAVVFYPCIASLVFNWQIPRLIKGGWNNGQLASYAGIVAAILLIGFVFQHYNQSRYSEMVTPATKEALDYLKTNDPKPGIISNSFTLSLWVAALNKVHSPFAFTAEPPRAYKQDDKDVRCILGWIDDCNPLESQHRLSVGYALIETRFPKLNERSPDNYLAPPDQWEVTANAPWLQLVFEKGTTKLWKIHDSSY